MKKILLAMTAVAAFTGSAFAADLPARTYTKAPPPAPVCELDRLLHLRWRRRRHSGLLTSTRRLTGAALPLAIDQRHGGSGWFGTVGAGYDWQVNPSWVFGIFADGQFGSIRGTIQDTVCRLDRLREDSGLWAAGLRARLSGGSERPVLREWRLLRRSLLGHQLFSTVSGAAVGIHTNCFNRNGWFVGGGVENNLNIFGITRARLVHEDRISLGLLRPEERSPSSSTATVPADRPRHPVQQLEPDDHRPRWSIASTGPVRSSPSTDLLPA